MRAIRPEGSNFTYQGGEDPRIADLPGILHDDMTFTCVYDFTEEERAQLAAGGKLAITIVQHPIPPIGVGVHDVEEAEAEERDGIPLDPDWRCRECGALYITKRALAQDFRCGHCGSELRLPGAAD